MTQKRRIITLLLAISVIILLLVYTGTEKEGHIVYIEKQGLYGSNITVLSIDPTKRSHMQSCNIIPK